MCLWLSNVYSCMFSPRDYFLFCSPSMPTNNDGKDLACRLDKRLTHSQARRLLCFSVCFVHTVCCVHGYIRSNTDLSSWHYFCGSIFLFLLWINYHYCHILSTKYCFDSNLHMWRQIESVFRAVHTLTHVNLIHEYCENYNPRVTIKVSMT